MSLDEAKELELQARCCASTAAELASSSVCNQATPTIAKVQSSKARACARSFRQLARHVRLRVYGLAQHVNPELRVKTAFRSSMTAHVHRDLPIDIAAAVDEFPRRHPRRMQMVDILSAIIIVQT